jgi:hypothetical protein
VTSGFGRLAQRTADYGVENSYKMLQRIRMDEYLVQSTAFGVWKSEVNFDSLGSSSTNWNCLGKAKLNGTSIVHFLSACFKDWNLLH